MAATLQILATKSLKKTPDVFLALLHTYTHIHTHIREEFSILRNFQIARCACTHSRIALDF